MTTEQQIRAAIVDRVYCAADSCSGSHIAECMGVVRGLLWTLTGEDCGSLHKRSNDHILTLAGVPHEVDHVDNMFTVSDEWCLANGLTKEGRLP